MVSVHSLVLAAVAALVSVILWCTPSAADDTTPLAGTWEFKDPKSGQGISLTLNPDGTGKLDDAPIKYTVAGNKLTLVQSADTTNYTFSLDGETITISGGDLDHPTPFTRKPGTAPKKGLGSKVKSLGTTPDPAPNPLNALGNVGGKTDTPKPVSKPALPGKWQANDGTLLQFNTDGTFVYGGQTIRYTAADNAITLTGPAGNVQWSYRLTGDKLQLTMEGETQTLTRIAPDPSPAKPDATAKADAPARAPAAKGGLPGTWQDDFGSQIQIKDDAIVYAGVSLPYTTTGNVMSVNLNGQKMDWPYQLNGDTMQITMNGQPMALHRVGGAPPAAEARADAKPDPAKPADKFPAKSPTLVGTWDSPEGSVQIDADGTLTMAGKKVRWTTDDKFITLTDDTGFLKIPYKLDGDNLVLGTGPTKTLTRSNRPAGAPAAADTTGAAGVYVGSESSLDPQFFMSITQYLTLYPDNTVGFTKSESGASRTMVTETLEHFRSWKNPAAAKPRTYGRWQADGNSLTVQWQGAFGNRTVQGRFDPSAGKIRLPNMGILQEGATVEYQRQ